MKVLHITNNYPSSKFPIFGIFVKEQIDSLQKVGINNNVFFINGRGKWKFLEYLFSIFKLKKYLTKKKFDLIHCHHALSAVCLILSKIKSTPILLSYQNNPKNELGFLIFKFLKNYIDIFIFKEKSLLKKENRSIYLPNGVNTSFFMPINKDRAYNKIDISKGRYILFISSNFLRKQKRYDRYIETINILKDDKKIKHIEPLILTNKPRSLIPYYINVSRVYLLTSDYEGSPNSVKECMACNIPVVSTPVGNVDELLKGVDGSYMSKSFKSSELADLIVKSLNFKGRINSREKIFEKKLDIHNVAIKLKKIYLILTK